MCGPSPISPQKLLIFSYPSDKIEQNESAEGRNNHDVIEADGNQSVEVHFERPTEAGFDSARCVLPTYQWKFAEGFSPDELAFFDEFLHNNAHLLYRYAARGGVHCA